MLDRTFLSKKIKKIIKSSINFFGVEINAAFVLQKNNRAIEENLSLALI